MDEGLLDARTYDKLEVRIYENPEYMAQAAAIRCATIAKGVLASDDTVNFLFSTGSSQFEFVEALRARANIDYSKLIGFHLDEYCNLSPDHPASFRKWLRERIEHPLKPKTFYYIDGNAPDLEAECSRYGQLVSSQAVHLGIIGVGENGHIAFNEPNATDFHDSRFARVVTLDNRSRLQQVREGWFADSSEVPSQAISLTVPAILACKEIISVVPESRKADAIQRALEGPIDNSCPASVLRTHSKATLFLDRQSAAKLAPV